MGLNILDSTGELGTYKATPDPDEVELGAGTMPGLRTFDAADSTGAFRDSSNKVRVRMVSGAKWAVCLAKYVSGTPSKLQILSTGASSGTFSDSDEVAIFSVLNHEAFVTNRPRNGFLNRTDSNAPTIADGTRTVSVAPAVSSFEVVAGEVLHSFSSAQTKVIADTTGLHWIYFDGDGVLQEAGTFSLDLITSHALVASVYWNATDGESVMFLDERHQTMDPLVHSYLHEAMHAQLVTGGDPSNYDVDTSGNDNSSITLAMSSAVIRDEDNRIACSDGVPQDLTPILSAPILRRSGASGVWSKSASGSYPVEVGVGGRAEWNEWTGSTWQEAEAGNGDFVLAHIMLTTDTRHPYVWVMGQNVYGSVALARAGAEAEASSLALGQLSDMVPEFVLLQTWIIQTRTNYTNAVGSRFRSAEDGDFIDWRQRAAGFGVSAPPVPQLQSVTMTTASHTLSVNVKTIIDPSGLTANQDLIVPAGAVAGDYVEWMTTKAAPVGPNYDVVLKGDTGVKIIGYGGEHTATEAIRFFLQQEGGRLLCLGSDEWIVEDDRRKAAWGKFIHSFTHTTALTWEKCLFTGATADKDNAGIVDITNSRIHHRRGGKFRISYVVAAAAVDSSADKLNGRLSLNGTTDIGASFGIMSGAAGSESVSYSMEFDRSAGDYTELEAYQSSAENESITYVFGVIEILE